MQNGENDRVGCSWLLLLAQF